jgi:hypothetical protein
MGHPCQTDCDVIALLQAGAVLVNIRGGRLVSASARDPR